MGFVDCSLAYLLGGTRVAIKGRFCCCPVIHGIRPTRLHGDISRLASPITSCTKYTPFASDSVQAAGVGNSPCGCCGMLPVKHPAEIRRVCVPSSLPAVLFWVAAVVVSPERASCAALAEPVAGGWLWGREPSWSADAEQNFRIGAGRRPGRGGGLRSAVGGMWAVLRSAGARGGLGACWGNRLRELLVERCRLSGRA